MKTGNNKKALWTFCFLVTGFIFNIAYIIVDLHFSAKLEEQEELRSKIDRALELGIIFDQENLDYDMPSEKQLTESSDEIARLRFSRARNYWKADPNLPEDLKKLLIANLARVLFANPDDIPTETKMDKRLQADLRISMNELDHDVSEDLQIDLMEDERDLSSENYGQAFLSN